MALISSNTAIVAAACTFGGPAACIVGIVGACLTNFYLAYKSTAGADSGSPFRRHLEGVEANIHELFLPAGSVTLLDKLKANIVEGQWASIGNTTVNGRYHDIHFHRQGSTFGIKAIQSNSVVTHKRDDSDDESGFVGTYFWEDNNQQAWNDWNNAQVHPAAQEISDYIVATKGEIVCADIIDQDGPMDAGVMTIGLDNNELGLTQSQWDSAMKICLAGDPSVP